MRLVVLGASSGLGRCIGVGLARGGDEVALMARREDRLADAVKEAGDNAFPVGCDVLDADACRKAIDTAAERLGGIDGFVYSVGIGPLAKLVDTDVATWQRTFETNVIGAAVATSAVIPHLDESKGTAVYLSSISGSQTLPWPGLGAYSVSKAALDKLIDAFRVEHPSLGFTRVVVGDCAGGEGDSMTGFPNDWDMDLAAEVGQIWVARGYMAGALLPVEELVRVVEQVLRSGAGTSIPSIVVTPRSVL
jgi:NAD(P)-dependent dehydrogenase (short-subunit alcohol dehydrogenase family)